MRLGLVVVVAACRHAVLAGHRGATAARIGERLAAREAALRRNASVSFPATRLDTPTTHYRARASGLALVLGTVERVGDTIVARFAVPTSGNYFVEVLRVGDADVVAVMENKSGAAAYPCASAPGPAFRSSDTAAGGMSQRLKVSPAPTVMAGFSSQGGMAQPNSVGAGPSLSSSAPAALAAAANGAGGRASECTTLARIACCAGARWRRHRNFPSGPRPQCNIAEPADFNSCLLLCLLKQLLPSRRSIFVGALG